jgi:hypothetical protein
MGLSVCLRSRRRFCDDAEPQRLARRRIAAAQVNATDRSTGVTAIVWWARWNGRRELNVPERTKYVMEVMLAVSSCGRRIQMIKIGLMGCGAVAGYGHLPAICETPGFSLHALFDPDRTRLQAAGNQGTFASAEDGIIATRIARQATAQIQQARKDIDWKRTL